MLEIEVREWAVFEKKIGRTKSDTAAGRRSSP
jgi:hypothetical protein